jgi:uncharacterized protein YjbI with pentapeptide repeats
VKKLLLVVIAVQFPTLSLAWDQEAMTRLKQTQECTGCDLSGGDLRWANVYAAELGGAPNLVNAVLDAADLSGANLYGANLEGTKLRGANLAGATLSWASLLGSDLTGADITGARFDGARFCGTTMPDGSQNNTNC